MKTKKIMINPKAQKEIIYIIIILAHVFMFGAILKNWMSTKTVIVLANEIPTPTPTPTPNPKPIFKNEIEEYIFDKFGRDYEKAMLLLKGNDKCGGENASLDQKAVNINKDGSKDYGIFQINDYYHPVYKLDLDEDWKANIDYAYRMYVNDDRTFKRWTAGRCIGI